MPKEVKIVVKGVRRREPDLRKYARALIQLVLERQDTDSETSTQEHLPPDEELS